MFALSLGGEAQVANTPVDAALSGRLMRPDSTETGEKWTALQN
jgi:hypothetical protein